MTENDPYHRERATLRIVVDSNKPHTGKALTAATIANLLADHFVKTDVQVELHSTYDDLHRLDPNEIFGEETVASLSQLIGKIEVVEAPPITKFHVTPIKSLLILDDAPIPVAE